MTANLYLILKGGLFLHLFWFVVGPRFFSSVMGLTNVFHSLQNVSHEIALCPVEKRDKKRCPGGNRTHNQQLLCLRSSPVRQANFCGIFVARVLKKQTAVTKHKNS